LRKIAFFDFDGTITKKDTLLELIKFQKGKAGFYAGFLLYSPVLLAYKTGIISNDRAKQEILKFFFGGMPVALFQDKCDAFVREALPALIRPGALTEIDRLKNEEVEIVVVSASAGNWLSQWVNGQGLELISTVLETKNGLVTGRIEGKNCHGEEKVRRIHASRDLSRYDDIYAYGDSAGDKPMLSLATRAYYKPFRDL
jgi:phosphatidylglycerophosphatase C